MDKKYLATIAAFALILLPLSSQAASDTAAANDPLKQRVEAHRQQQHQQNAAFKERLQATPPDQRISLVKEHREARYLENRAFAEQIHNERMSRLRARLDQSKKLTDAQRAERVSAAEDVHRRQLQFHTQQHQENMQFLDGLAAMSAAERKEALKHQHERQKTEAQTFHEGLKAERMAIHGQSRTAPLSSN
jgi:hypothetical protein